MIKINNIVVLRELSMQKIALYLLTKKKTDIKMKMWSVRIESISERVRFLMQTND